MADYGDDVDLVGRQLARRHLELQALIEIDPKKRYTLGWTVQTSLGSASYELTYDLERRPDMVVLSTISDLSPLED